MRTFDGTPGGWIPWGAATRVPNATPCQDAVMGALTVDHFLPGRASADDLAEWSAIFSAGQAEASGGSGDAASLAGGLLAEKAQAVLRWVVRKPLGGPILGVAELRPQPAKPKLGYLRLFVTPSARRAGAGSTL